MTTHAHLPKLLQLELTNACNFSCEMCLHSSAHKAAEQFLGLDAFRRLAAEVFPLIDSLVLLGWGEPLMHPDFLEMLRIARTCLPNNAKIKVTSNGSLLKSSIIDTIFNEGLIDFLTISCDKPPGSRDLFPGHHAAVDLVVHNLDYALRHPMRSRMHISIATVIMRSNIASLPELVEQFAGRGADRVFVSHVFPYHAPLESEMLYSLMSSEAYAVFEKLGNIDPQAWFGLPHTTDPAAPEKAPPAGISSQQARSLEQARADGIQLNYALFQQIKKRIPEFEITHTIFEQSRRCAEYHGMLLELPPVFGSLQQRACPYVRENAAVIRADGAVVPCFKNLYPHSAYFNGRMRAYNSHVFGSIMEMPFADIWNCSDYLRFRADMHAMNDHIAWCGDCSFSLYYCYFAEEARQDCMLNEPFCSECPFSLNLTRCVL